MHAFTCVEIGAHACMDIYIHHPCTNKCVEHRQAKLTYTSSYTYKHMCIDAYTWIYAYRPMDTKQTAELVCSWAHGHVIHHGLCPFAKPALRTGTVCISVCPCSCVYMRISLSWNLPPRDRDDVYLCVFLQVCTCVRYGLSYKIVPYEQEGYVSMCLCVCVCMCVDATGVLLLKNMSQEQ